MADPANALPAAASDRVECPACGSIHSADGRTLFERSPRLQDLEAAGPKLKKLEIAFGKLQTQLEKKKEKPSPAPAPAPVAAPAPAPVEPARKKHGRYL